MPITQMKVIVMIASPKNKTDSADCIVDVENRNSIEPATERAHLAEKKSQCSAVINIPQTYTIHVHIHLTCAAEANKFNAAGPSALGQHFFCVMFNTGKLRHVAKKYPI